MSHGREARLARHALGLGGGWPRSSDFPGDQCRGGGHTLFALGPLAKWGGLFVSLRNHEKGGGPPIEALPLEHAILQASLAGSVSCIATTQTFARALVVGGL